MRPKNKRKLRPVNEISNADVELFMQVVTSFDGYPRLRDLPKVLKGMDLVKINALVRFLERSGSIVIDSDGYIVWSRNSSGDDNLTLAEVAEISHEAKEFFKPDADE